MIIQQAGKLAGYWRYLIVFCCVAVSRVHAQAGGKWVQEHNNFETLASPKPPGIFLVLQTLTEISTGRVVHLRSVYFDSEKLKLAVIDNPRGDETLSDAMQRHGALAGTNGGYFHPDRTPVGLEISGGKLVHPFERAKLLTGLLAISPKRAAVLRSSEFSPKEKLDSALQAGPFLVDQRKVVSGLNDGRRAWRTGVVESESGDEQHGMRECRLVVCEPVTLAEFAEILATRLTTGTHEVIRALNLDGGSSTGMWIPGHDTSDIGNPNVNVRNYVAIVPR